MSVAAWLEELALAVGEEELRAALKTAIAAGDLGDHEMQRRALARIVAGRGLPRVRRRPLAVLGKVR